MLRQTTAAMGRPLFGRLFGFKLLLPVKLTSLLLQRLQVVFIKKQKLVRVDKPLAAAAVKLFQELGDPVLTLFVAAGLLLDRLRLQFDLGLKRLNFLQMQLNDLVTLQQHLLQRGDVVRQFGWGCILAHIYMSDYTSADGSSKYNFFRKFPPEAETASCV